MKLNEKNIFNPYIVNGAAITERLIQLIEYYGESNVEAAFIFEKNMGRLSEHIYNLVETYTFTEVLEMFECITNQPYIKQYGT